MTYASPYKSATLTTRVINLNRLRWARAIWIAIVLVNTLYGVINLIAYTSGRLQPCSAEPCLGFQLSVHATEQYALSGVPFAVAALMRPVLETVLVMVYTGVGLLIFRRRSDSWMGLISSLTLCLHGFQLTYSVDTLPMLDPRTLPINLILTTGMLLVAYITLYLFPNGRLEPRWAVIPLVVTLVYEISRGIIINLPQLGINPGQLLIGTLGLCAIGLGLQIRNYRLLAPAERQQIKWLLFAFALFMGGLSLSAFQRAVLPSFDGGAFAITSLLAVFIQHALYLGLPLAFAFSMLRYRLWDADLVINRTLAYVASIGVLIVMFLGLFFTLNAALVRVVGADSTLPLVISAALTLLAFTPVSRRLAHFIDRQVYGFRVDLFDISKRPPQETYFVPAREAKAGRYIGLKVGGYELNALLGKGAMSEVYTAQDISTGAIVAVKLLPSELAAQADPRIRFQREADALRQLSHPNIVHLISSGMSDGMHYLAMELVSNETLLDRLNQHTPLAFNQIMTIIRDVAAALDVSHAAGIIHRDVKPSNILLRPTAEGARAVLSDFGIVKLVRDTAQTGKEPFIGTPYYIAPEQIITARDVTAKADIYSLGIMAYQMLTGKLPFEGNPAQLVYGHLNQPAPNPTNIVPTLPRSVGLAVMKALEKDPAQRYSTAGAFAKALVAS